MNAHIVLYGFQKVHACAPCVFFHLLLMWVLKQALRYWLGVTFSFRKNSFIKYFSSEKPT